MAHFPPSPSNCPLPPPPQMAHFPPSPSNGPLPPFPLKWPTSPLPPPMAHFPPLEWPTSPLPPQMAHFPPSPSNGPLPPFPLKWPTSPHLEWPQLSPQLSGACNAKQKFPQPTICPSQFTPINYFQ